MGLDQVPSGNPISRQELHRWLRAWLAVETNDEMRIDGRTDKEGGRKKWIYVKDSGKTYWINADTKRKGVDLYMRFVEHFGADLAWSIDPKWSKKLGVKTSAPRIVYGPAFLQATSFFMYATE